MGSQESLHVRKKTPHLNFSGLQAQIVFVNAFVMHRAFSALLVAAGWCARPTLQWAQTTIIPQPVPPTPSKDRFGSVALSGNGKCALVGAPGCGILCQSGTVWGLSRPGGASSSWSGIAALSTPPGTTSGGFGSALALDASCNAAFIGAPSASSSRGRVFVFVPGPCTGQWCLSATLSVTDVGLPTFGNAVATNEGGWACAVGAKNSGSANGQGSVWFCTAAGLLPSAASWTCEKLPLVPGAAQSDWLGTAVALSGDATVLVATAPYRASQGTVFVYTRATGANATGTAPWVVQQALDPNTAPCALGTSSNRNFGVSVALTPDASTIAVGAAQGGSLYGAALIFSRSPVSGLYACTALLRPAGKVLGDSVGSTVALGADSNTVLVGSALRKAFVFQRASAAAPWVESASLANPNSGLFNEAFSERASLSFDASVAMLGAPGTLSAADTYAGFAVLYDSGTQTTPSASPSSASSPTPSPQTMPSPTPTPSPSPPASPTPSPTASVTATPSLTPTASVTATPSQTATLGSSVSSSSSLELSASASATASGSPLGTATPTPAATPPSSGSPVALSATTTVTPTATASPTSSFGASVSVTPLIASSPTSSTSPLVSNSPTSSLSNGASPSPSGAPDAAVSFALTITAASVTSPLLVAVQVLANALQLRRDVSKYAAAAVGRVCPGCPPPIAFVSDFGSSSTPSFAPDPAVNTATVRLRRLADAAVVGVILNVPAPRDAGSPSAALSQQAAAANAVADALRDSAGLAIALAPSLAMIRASAGAVDPAAAASNVVSSVPAPSGSSLALLALLVLIPAVVVTLVLVVRCRGRCCGSVNVQRTQEKSGVPPCPPPATMGFANPLARTLAATGVSVAGGHAGAARQDPSASPASAANTMRAPGSALNDATTPSLRAPAAAPVTLICPHTGDPYILDSRDGEPLWLDGIGGRPLAKGWRRYEDSTGDVWYARGDVTEWTPEYA